MKRFLSLRLTLCLFLLGMVCNVAWAQPTVSPAPVDGQWAEGTTWYQVQTKSGFYLRGDDVDANGNVQMPSSSTLDAAALWCVVGDAANGYTFYNMAKGATTPMCMNNSTSRAQFVALGTDGYTATFDFVSSQKTDESNTYWCVRKHTGENNNYYWNPQGTPKQLTYWNAAGATDDNGSAFLFTEFKQVDITTFSTEASPKWHSVEFKTGGHFITDKGSGNNLVTADAADSDEEYWMFIGDAFGFKMKSRLGNYVYYDTSASRFKTTNDVENATPLTFVAGTTDGTWELQRVGSAKCMNQNGGTDVGVQLGEWNKGDSNNPFYLNEVEIFDHFIEPVFSDNNNETWFMIRFAKGDAHLASNGANDQAVTANLRNVSSQWWKFVGTAKNFQLVSKDGRYVTLKSGTATNGQTGDLLHMVSEPDANGFSIIESTNANYPETYEIVWNGASGKSFNQWGGAGAGKSVGVWTTGDNNNPLYIYMPDPNLLSPFDIEGISSYTPTSPLTLWYKNAASNMEVSDQWMEYSLPIGNGQFGASIFGGVAREEVQFNEKTLWSGTKNDNSSEYGDYENFGSLYIDDISEVFGEGKAVKNYYRQLDLSNATASVHYTSTDGAISFTREYIASNPDKVVAMRLTADAEEKISIKVTLKAGRPGLRATTTYAEGTATFGGKLETITYNALAKVVPTGGTMTTTADGITVKDADEVLIILGGATDFDAHSASYVSGTEGLTSLVSDRVDAAAEKGWNSLYADHVADHKTYFDRCNFVLDGAANNMPTDELIRQYANRTTGTEDYALMLEQLYFAYGRYLEMGSSRGVDLPANLQGIWNNSSEPAWNGDIHANINVQMNYWPAEPTNLSEMHMPFLNYIINMANSAEWKALAQKKGSTRPEAWTMLTENNIFGGFGSFAQNAVINNAWYVSHLWQHYRYTLDQAFLEKAFPAMWGASMFWVDRLVLNTTDDTYECPNEYSPEHGPGAENATAHSQQLVWELFDNTLKAVEILGESKVNADDLATLRERFSKLDKGLATEVYDGQWGTDRIASGTNILREWKTSNYTAGANGHRHMSHLMCLYPFNQITEGTDLFNAAINSMLLRGDASTGWSMGWKINLWARALDGDHSHDILELALRHHSVSGGGVYYNLYDSHSPFQIDGNFGACAGIAEMLMQSHTEVIDILPALPSVWQKGSITGLKAVGNFTVSLNWEEGKAQQVTIVSHKGAPLKVRCNRGVIALADAKITVDGTEVAVEVENSIATIPCTQGQTVVIDFTQEAEKVSVAEYVVNMTTGTFAGSGNYRSSWTYTTTETNPAALTLRCDANNMNNHDGLIQLHSGSDASSTYTLTVPAGYTIVSYSFDYAFGNSGTGEKKLVVGGQEYPVTAEKQTLNVENVNAETTSFELSGANESVKLSSFVVVIKAPSAAELTDAKNTAKAGADANASKLGEALGYYSYAANGEKLYTLDDVKAAIDAAETIAEVVAITESFGLNIPEVGKYYRIKGISGNYIDASSIYNNANATTGQMSMKSAETCNYLGTIFLLDEGNRLKNVATGTYVKDTHSIGANKNDANSWTFAASTRTLGYLTLTSNYSGSKQLHDNSGNRADRCGSICGERHDFTIEEVKTVSLTVNAPAKVNASATWNGETKTLPATWTMFGGVTVTDAVLSISNYEGYNFEGFFEDETSLGTTVTISSLDADRTLTAKFSPAFLSATYGEKWVRLQNCSNNDYFATMENVVGGGNGKTAKLDYADEKQLWCLVGTAESFVLYNKAAGDKLALKVTAANYGNGSQATLENDTQASWKLIEQDFGFALVPTHNTNSSDLGINMYAGAGGYLKLYGTGSSNKGSYWVVEKADVENPVTLNVEVDQVWESSPRVAELTFTVNGKASQTRILGNVAGQALYLPAGATYEVSSMTYRGYTYNGCEENDGALTASYTANNERTLFYSPKDGHPYRIPAIATAPNGDIFAICDYRPCNKDIGNGDVDIVCRISSDNGVTWDDEIVLANGDGGSTNRMETGYGDPAIVVDRESNKILVMMVAGRTVCGNSRWDASKIGDKEATEVNRAARIYGTLNESTGEWEWTQPEEVTDEIYKLFLDGSNNATVTSYFIGAGKICQSRVVKKGEYYRLYCALWTRDQGNRVIYSDDFGGTWNVLGTIDDRPASNGNEPKCEELPDGTVILSSRVGGGRYFNVFTFNDNTYTTGTWGTVANSTTVRDGSGGTNGEIYKVKAIRKSDGQICDVMLQSVPAGSGRTNVTVWYKEMDYTTAYTPATFAADWTVGKQVSQKGSAYSTMILQADGRIGFFFEEEPGEYSMVYIPYTLEDLTADKYRLYTVNSSISQHEIGTFYASEAMQIPEGVKAYVAEETPVMNGTDAEGNAEGTITMRELENLIPAKTGVVLRAEANDYKFIPSISYGTAVDGNMLIGWESPENTATDRYDEVALPENNTTNYVLTVKDGAAGFYKKTAGFKVYNNKAYLNVPASMQTIRIRFNNNDGTTDIIEVPTEALNGNGEIYDLSGRRVEKATKGVFIVNGKKVIF